VCLFYPFITSSNFGAHALHTGNRATASFADFLPEPDSPDFTASKLVAALDSPKKEVAARAPWYFIYGMARKQVLNRFTRA
jgi:hypothetical protein